MATGIPGSGKGSRRRNDGLSYRLEYDGKMPASEVLGSIPVLPLLNVLTIEGQPQNQLVYGDNLSILRTLANDVAIAEKIKLIYIDPPYATGSRFESRRHDAAYADYLQGAQYLEFLRRRLILMWELLAQDGSIYVHLDDNMAFPVKVLMDEIFGPKNFRNWITRKKCNPKNYTRRQYGNISDYILFYSKSDNWVWNQSLQPWDEAWADREYPYIEEGTGRRYKKVPVHAPGVRNGVSGGEWRGRLPPPGKHWQYKPSTLDEMDARGEIYWSPNGNPRRKVYLDSKEGLPVQDIWLEFKDAHNQNIRITGYPTEKNAALLSLIISASSNPGDLVLDGFAGSGTTPVCAEMLGRQWIAIDNSLLALETMIQRLAKGSEPMGDFVGKRRRLRDDPPLFVERVLRSGLTVLVEERFDLEVVTEQTVLNWKRLLTEGVL